MSLNESIQMAAKELEVMIIKEDPALMRNMLIEKINELIRDDFQKLVAILYRIDVSEKNLKDLLRINMGIDSGPVIADLIIQREEQKIASRKQFRNQDEGIDEDEKW